jgi:hypothetical protein
MKNVIGRRKFLSMVAMVVAASSTGCVSDKVLKKSIEQSPELQVPTRVTRPIDVDLEKFGTMIRAYRTEDADLVVAVDFMPNDSGIDKELPADIGSYARSALEHIDRPVVTYRTLPAAIGLKGPAANSIFLTTAPPKPPAPAFKLVGVLERASEQLTAAKNGRGDTRFGGGSTAADGSATRDDTRTITSVTVSFTLETPDLLAVRGTTVAYRIFVEHRERNRSISFYIGGNGIGEGSRLTATQDMGDALYDATAASVMSALGNALLIPYYRCNGMFKPDQALNRRVREAMNRMTPAELEENIKKYLFVDGHDEMDMTSASLSKADRGVVAQEMKRRSLDSNDHDALVEMAFHLWRDLDYVKGAARVDDRLAKTYVLRKEQIEAAKISPPAPAPTPQRSWSNNPRDWGWPDSAFVTVLDLSRIKEVTTRERILAVVGKCDGFQEIKVNADRTIAGIRMSSPKRSELQRVLRQGAFPVDYVWAEGSQPRLILNAK